MFLQHQYSNSKLNSSSNSNQDLVIFAKATLASAMAAPMQQLPIQSGRMNTAAMSVWSAIAG
jgi:hypothetical protein